MVCPQRFRHGKLVFKPVMLRGVWTLSRWSPKGGREGAVLKGLRLMPRERYIIKGQWCCRGSAL